MIPPCSGIKSPKSFSPASLFSNDAVKSPTNPNKAKITPCIGPKTQKYLQTHQERINMVVSGGEQRYSYQFNLQKNITYGHFCTQAPKVLNNMLKTHPPMTPSIVLFGEAIPAAELRAPSFVFPYLRPAKYPPTSLKAMQSHDQNIKLAPVVTGRWIVFGKNLGIQSRMLVLWMRSSMGLINGAKRVGSLAAPMRRNLGRK